MTQTTTAVSDAHETSGPPVLGDVDSFPSYAELARTLVEGGAVAAVATLTGDGFPYTSTVPISIDVDGAPVICVSELAEHTRNLRQSGRASVLVQQRPDGDADPLALARVTFVGSFVEFTPTPEQRDRHLAAHPHAAHYVDFADFGWWRFASDTLRYVGGFGVMGWADGTDYAGSAPDPVVPAAPSMIRHLNDDHADACLDIARRLGGAGVATRATVTAVDRHGITFDVHGEFAGHRSAVSRVAFPAPLAGPDDVRSASVDLVRRAREVAGAAPADVATTNGTER